jgi:hypothetical protein
MSWLAALDDFRNWLIPKLHKQACFLVSLSVSSARPRELRS